MRLGRPRSLFGRLVISQLTVLLLLTIMLPAVILVSLHWTANAYVEAQLRQDARLLSRVIQRGQPTDEGRLARLLGPLYAPLNGSRAFELISPIGDVLAQGGASAALPAPSNLGQDMGFSAVGKLDVYASPIRLHGQLMKVVVAQDRTRPEVVVDDVVTTFLLRTLWVIPLILLSSTAANLFVIRRVSGQLRQLSAEADRIKPTELDARLEIEELPMEIRGLASAANDAFDRVVAGYRRQSQFVSSVAHELRTPMALATLRCDALPPSPEKEALLKAIDQASHVISQLLALARIEGRLPTIGSISIETVAREAVEASAPLVFRSGRSIEMTAIEATAKPAAGNASLLGIAVTNLIDNAIRHTSAGSHIVVHAGFLEISVRDNGPGLQKVSVADETRYQSVGQARIEGAGLGLAIVQRIMTAMHGSMQIQNLDPGAIVTLALPAFASDGR